MSTLLLLAAMVRARVLQCVAVWCSVVQCGDLGRWMSTLLLLATMVNAHVLQCDAVCSRVVRARVLQRVAACCSVLQCGAVWVFRR